MTAARVWVPPKSAGTAAGGAELGAEGGGRLPGARDGPQEGRMPGPVLDVPTARGDDDVDKYVLPKVPPLRS